MLRYKVLGFQILSEGSDSLHNVPSLSSDSGMGSKENQACSHRGCLVPQNTQPIL